MSENEQTQEQAEQDFAAGFDGTATPPPQQAEVTQSEKPEVEAKPEGEQQTAQEVEQPETPTVAGLSEQQVRELLAKASQVDSLREEFTKTRDTIFGKFGELNRNLQTIQKAPATAAGAKLTKEALKNIAERLGPEAAEAIANDLSGAITAPEIDWDERLKPHLDRVRAEMQVEMERRALLKEHKDFYQQKDTPEFQLWMNQQPEDVRTQWVESIDADWLGGKMTEFKTWRDGLIKRQEKKQRLEEAITPTGTQAAQAGISDEDAFLAGFNGN